MLASADMTRSFEACARGDVDPRPDMLSRFVARHPIVSTLSIGNPHGYTLVFLLASAP